MDRIYRIFQDLFRFLSFRKKLRNSNPLSAENKQYKKMVPL